MSPDLLDHVFVEVTRITHQRSSDIESVLEAEVHLVTQAKERPLLQLGAGELRVVDVLHPHVMSRGGIILDMLLENDDIRVGNLLSICSRENRGCFIVDGANADGVGRCQQRQQGEAEEALHAGQLGEEQENRQQREEVG